MQSIEPEIWKPVSGYDGRYEVSTLGRVRNNEYRDTLGRRVNARIKKPGVDSWGYCQANLRTDGKQKLIFVHRLVLETFVGPMPDGLMVLHVNGDQKDNRLSNLRYGTASENGFDSVTHGTHPQSRLTHCKRGHILQHPNLVKSALKTNRRDCRACSLARNRSYQSGRPFSETEAEEIYQSIMRP